MGSLLPFLPCSSKCDVLPTAFDIGKTPGLIFYGDRRVEFVGVTHKPTRTPARNSRPVNQFNELLVPANVVIPTSVVQYYFEVTIEKSVAGSIIR